MCEWSSWSWICQGHYEIELAILLAMAFLVVLVLILVLALNRSKKARTIKDNAIDLLKESFLQGQISSDEFLRKCNEIPEEKTH